MISEIPIEELAQRSGLDVPADLVGWRGVADDGRVWIERDKPGAPGVVERRHIASLDRYADGTCSGAVIPVSSVPASRPRSTKAAIAPKTQRINRVTLAPQAHAQLEVASMRTRNIGLECGGALHGRAFDGEFVVGIATRASKNESNDSMELSLSPIVSATKRAESLISGDFHCHPTGGLLPSDADKKAWRSLFEWNRNHGATTPWVSIIVDGWSKENPAAAAYVTDDLGTREIPLHSTVRS